MINQLHLYKKWEEASFVEREGRFTLLLRRGKKVVRAYLPNTGRIEEFLVEGGRFFITATQMNKFKYRVVSTFYHNDYVLLDTNKVNDIVYTMIKKNLLPGLNNAHDIYREKNIGNNRFDFFLTNSNSSPMLLEVKTCTLCHNGVALFPDAPSRRAKQHIEVLSRLTNVGYQALMIFIIPNRSAHTFMPNFHTDPDFSEKILSEKRVTFKAFSLSLLDPVSIDLGNIKEIKIECEKARLHCRQAGSYVLLLRNEDNKFVEVGKMGRVSFKKGYYVYVGSGMHSLDKRIERHFRKKKKKFWHIDYITPYFMNIERVYTIRRMQKIEPKIADRIEKINKGFIKGFGASDSGKKSHLFYFKTAPQRERAFLDVILDFQTLSD